MSKCSFLSTYDEYVECSKDCSLYNWAENNNKCPFTELGGKKKALTKIFDYDSYKEDESLPVSMLYKEDYV